MALFTTKDHAEIRPGLRLRYAVCKSSAEFLPYTSSSKRGSSSTDLIVLHHGHTGSMETFEPCAAQLLKLRPQATILLLDCRGAGQSDKPSGATSYSIELLVEDTLLLVDRLFSPGQRFAMVGHSMGGLTSLALALSHPERAASGSWGLLPPHPFFPRRPKQLRETTRLGAPLHSSPRCGVRWPRPRK